MLNHIYYASSVNKDLEIMALTLFLRDYCASE